MRRVVIVLADGLRPDAISPTHMPLLDALSRAYTMALHAKTVRPSRTAAALTSLATGIAPSSHGFIEPGLAFLGKLMGLRPLGREPERAGPDVTRRHQLTRSVSLLDVPPTVLWWSGVEVPASYEGRVLSQAFTRVPGAAGAAV